MTPVQVDLPYLSDEPDRHGNPRLYVRRNGKRLRIREEPGTPAFTKAYAAAVDRLGATPSKVPALAVTTYPRGSLGWLGAQYFASKGEGGFLDLDEDSRRARRNSLELDCFTVHLSDEDPDPMGNCPLKFLSGQKMRRMIEAADGKGARTNRRKHLSALCAWGVDNDHLATNPVRDIKAGRAVKTAGYYTWMIEDVEQFVTFHKTLAQSLPESHPLSIRSRKAILAMSLILFSGSRRQDMVTLGKQHTRSGEWIRYVPKKTVKKRPTRVQKPLLPALRQVLIDSETILGPLTFLVTERGKPFSEAGIGNWFRDRCDEAGLPQCTAHGLKKAAATIAAENGATDRQMMAMFDWESPKMAWVYTKGAEQKRLAGDAMFLISLDRTANENCLTDQTGDVAPDRNVS